MTGTLVLIFVPGDKSKDEMPVLVFFVACLALGPVLLVTYACCRSSLDSLTTGG